MVCKDFSRSSRRNDNQFIQRLPGVAAPGAELDSVAERLKDVNLFAQGAFTLKKDLTLRRILIN